MSDCVFCKIIDRQLQSNIVAETEDMLVIKDRAPKAKIHYLIMPKKHIKDIQSFETNDFDFGSKMLSMSQKLSKDVLEAKDFRLIINSGYNAGQRVFHVHAHFLAGTNLSEFE